MGELIESIQIQDTFRPLNQAEQKFAPKDITLKGNASLLSEGGRVSIIGSRGASAQGLARARRLSRLLVENGITVVSGLAKGVDTVAHRAAIEAGGRTIAVLGTPIDKVYPPENRDLQELIGESHLLVTQFPVGHPILKKNFPLRNRLMALISDATIIVEANNKSGTIHQGWEALRLARPLYILESAHDPEASSWSSQFLNYGAQLLSDESFDSLLETIPSHQSALADAGYPF
ncbi:MAG TPA: DNA-processing protein DprA [Pyrinomonadaceae bacterium]|nr:DNA-processing protein DprA [Pyrinomonadaceae bacterium]